MGTKGDRDGIGIALAAVLTLATALAGCGHCKLTHDHSVDGYQGYKGGPLGARVTAPTERCYGANAASCPVPGTLVFIDEVEPDTNVARVMVGETAWTMNADELGEHLQEGETRRVLYPDLLNQGAASKDCPRKFTYGCDASDDGKEVR